MRVIRGAWSDETAHAREKQSGRSLVEAKADCVTERVNKRLLIAFFDHPVLGAAEQLYYRQFTRPGLARLV